MLSSLFQPYTTSNSNNLNPQGVGLGLYIAKQLIGCLGPLEHVEVESQINQGTTFSFLVYKNLEIADLSIHKKEKSYTVYSVGSILHRS